MNCAILQSYETRKDNFIDRVQKFGVLFVALIFADENFEATCEMCEWKSSFGPDFQSHVSLVADETFHDEKCSVFPALQNTQLILARVSDQEIRQFY